MALLLAISGCGDSSRLEVGGTTQGLGEAVTRWSVSDGLWSAPSTWAGGVVPQAGEVVGIATNTEVTLNVASPPAVGGLLIQGTLELDESQSVELKIESTLAAAETPATGTGGAGGSSGSIPAEYNNIVVSGGTLRLRPASASQRHTITFENIDESKVRGGGMEPISTDPGLWVTGHGQLDAQGAAKVSWTRLVGAAQAGQTSITVESALGWQVGDTVVVVPTLRPSSGSSSWDSYDTFEIGAISGGVLSLRVPGTTTAGALAHDHPVVNGQWRAEVLNLTRNVVIQGTPGHRAHVAMMHLHVPQTLKDVEIRHMGPRKSYPGVNGQQSILGRYGLHFHMSGNGTRGTLVKGLALHHIGSHAYVPHASHGITMEDCVSHDTWDEAYWWDRADADASDDTKWVRNVASKVQVNPPNSALQLAGFVLGAGQRNSITDSVAVGVTSERFAAGFIWPENEIRSAWEFKNNIAHNTSGRGFFTWQNGAHLHVVEDSVIYHNAKGSVEHGAYALRYRYRNIKAFGNGGGFYVHSVSADDAVSPQIFENIEIDGDGLGHGFIFLKHNTQLGLQAPTLIRGSRVSNLSPQGIALGFAYDDISQSPGDPGRDNNQLNPSTHREWLNVLDSDFSGVPLSHRYFVSGRTDGGINYGTLADSEISEESPTGAKRIFRSTFFDPAFEEHFETSLTSGWSWHWVSQQVGARPAWSVANGKGLLAAGTAQGAAALAYVKTRTAADVEQTVTISISEGSGWAGLVARRPDGDRESYYRVQVGGAASGRSLSIGRVLDGVFIPLGSDAASLLVPGDAYKLSFKIQTSGSQTWLRAKLWPASASMPTAWTLEAADSAPLLQRQAGRFGVIGGTQSGSVAFDDYVSMITDALPFDAGWNAKVQTFVADGTPKVTAGNNRSTSLPQASLPLDGSVRHGGVLNPQALTYAWSKLEGSGTVSFASVSSPVTVASFDSPGRYRLRLSASDGTVTGSDDLTVIVAPAQASGSVSENWNGSGAWPDQWKTISSYAVAPPVIDRVGNEGRIIYNGVANMPSNGGATVAYVKDRHAENVELLTTAQAISNNGVAGLVARLSDDDQDTYLAAAVGTAGSSQSSIRIWAVVDGSARVLAEKSLLFGTQTAGLAKTHLRFGVETLPDGRLHLRARAWLAGTTEDTSGWTLEVPAWESRLFQGRTGRFGVLASAGQSGRGGLFDDFSAVSNDRPALVTVEESWSGLDGAVWPAQWGPAVAPSVADIFGNEGRIPWFGQLHINSYNARDVNLLTRVRVHLNNGRAGLFALRSDDDDDTYVAARFGGTASGFDAVRLYYVVDGVKTDIKTLTSPFAYGQNYQMRFVVESNADGTLNFRLRIWDPSAGAEPSTWTLSQDNWQHARFAANAPEPNNTSGRFGVLNEPGQAGRRAYFDDFKAVFAPR